MNTKICLVCGLEFSDYTGKLKYCSPECYHSARIKYPKIPCEVCGKLFKSRKLKQHYCSNKCNGIANRTIADRKCETCGKVFSIRERNSKYCSRECFILRPSNPVKVRVCPYCHKEFINRSNKKYCSKDCSIRGISSIPTSIEKELYEFLDNKQVVYEKQLNLKFTVPDAFIPNLNLCIYADGKYWHSYKINKGKDRKQEKRLKELGYKVVRLKERKDLSLDLSALVSYLK